MDILSAENIRTMMENGEKLKEGDILNVHIIGDVGFRNDFWTKLPKNITINGYVSIRNKNITKLPDNLTIKKYLNIADNPIEELPKNLNVGEFLNLANTKIKKIPLCLNVKTVLYLHTTKVSKIHEKAKIEQIYYNDHRYSIPEYNKACGYSPFEKIIFSRKNYNIIKKLLYIPELFQNVYYENKETFISLLQKL